MWKSNSSMINSSNRGKYVSAVVLGGALLLKVWISYSKYRWKKSVQSFVEENAKVNDQNNNDADKDILLLVSPVSGGGKSIKYFETCLQTLKETGRSVHVIITTGPNDFLQMTERLGEKNISQYKAIAIMSGDSSITEFVQHELLKNQGKWPYAPILHLPTGTGNAICSEMFCGGSHSNNSISIEEIIRHGLTKSQRASVLQITSANNNTALNGNKMSTHYALHNAFDGAQRHMLDTLDGVRADYYPAFGPMIVIPTILSSIMTTPASIIKSKLPYFLAIITDTDGAGTQLGFGINRLDDQMITIRLVYWPGRWKFLTNVALKYMSGELAKEWKEGKLPDYIAVEKTNKYILDGGNDKEDDPFNMYLDGTGTLSCKGALPVTMEVIPNAIPYFVHDTKFQKL